MLLDVGVVDLLGGSVVIASGVLLLVLASGYTYMFNFENESHFVIMIYIYCIVFVCYIWFTSIKFLNIFTTILTGFR